LLYTASIVLACAAFLKVFTLVTSGFFNAEEKAIFTTLVLIGLFSSRIAQLVSFIFIFAAAWFWTNFSRSRIILINGWILGLLLSLVPTIIPINYMMFEQEGNVIYGMYYAITVIPTYLTIIGGVTLGTKHVYNFAPSPLTGAMVVLSNAFSVIMPFATLSFIIQGIGNALLLVGVILLVAGPSLVVSMGSKFTAVTVFSSSENLIVSRRILLVASTFSLVGYVIIVAWFITFSKDGIVFITQEVDGMMIEGLFPIQDLVSAILQAIGGMMFQAALWTDIMMHMARNDSLMISKLDSDLAA
jgi:hypothetical protein